MPASPPMSATPGASAVRRAARLVEGSGAAHHHRAEARSPCEHAATVPTPCDSEARDSGRRVTVPFDAARDGLPATAAAPAAPHPDPPPPGGRDPSRRRRPGRPAVRARGHRRAPPDRLAAGRGPAHPRQPPQGGRAGSPDLGHRRRDPLRHPRPQGRRGHRGLGPRRHRPGGPAGPARRRRRRGRAHGRPVPRRVHRPRPLRRCSPPDGLVDNDATLERYAEAADGPGRGRGRRRAPPPG